MHCCPNGLASFVIDILRHGCISLPRYYAQIYLYTFICLFIYVNISLFTAVILDSYSLIKYYYQHGFPKSDLFEFIDECSDPPEGESYRQVQLVVLF